MAEERILVVDDEEDLCEILQFNLEQAGYIVDVAYSAEEVLKQDNLSSYQLFMLDVMMGEISGFKLGTILRKNEATEKIPIIYLTAKDTETDKLRGFSIGADDYISKPYSINEVLARVKAVLKRTSGAISAPASKNELPTTNQSDILVYNDLRINLINKTTFIGEEEINLTKKEFELLSLFLQCKNRVLSREQLLESIWKGESNVLDRTIDVNITRLRKKIKPYDKNLVTKQGYGYIFTEK
ncbi:MAG: response regulator transcription factor [Paludibacteraceae bacterium]|nr:response regulator transcription factor [Paludibacteraceae bacterium]